MPDFGPVIPFGNVAQPLEEEARAAIIPVPLEATVSYGHGTALGPAATILASANMELYDEALDMETIDLGILTRTAVNVRGSMADILVRVEAAVERELAGGRLPVLLGGEHSLTLGALRALVKRHGPSFTVLSLDAHLDLRDSYEDEPLSHACVMRRAMDLGLSVRHLGARSCSIEEARFVKEAGLKPVWASTVLSRPDWLEMALEGLSGPVYLTLDVDGFDPSVMPATGTPEPGGLNWTQVTAWLKAVCQRCPVLGLDLVELAPLPDQTAWDFTVARLLYRAVGLALTKGGPPV